MPDVLLVQGTALQLPLRDASVHCVVTSPPYYGLRDYGTGTWQGGDPACTHSRRTSLKEASITTESRPTNTNHEQEGWRGSVCGRCGATRVDQQLGLEATVEAYVAAMVQVFREVKRVLHPMGTLFVNMGDSYASSGTSGYQRLDELGERLGTGGGHKHSSHLCGRAPTPAGLPAKNLLGMPWRLAFALQADGWILRADIIWDKPSCMPESVQDRPTRSHEYVFLFSKQARYFYDAEAVKEASTETSGWAKQRTAGVDTWSYTRPVNDHAPNNHNGQGGRFGLAGTRNARTVWRIASEPFSGSHFATFPPALVRRCLLAGAPTQVCAACGAPYRRIVERQRLLDGHTPVSGAFSRPEEPFRIPPNGVGHWRYSTQTTDHGFTAACGCEAGTQRCTILDPFAGSGTVGLVARELGHHAVLCDLSWPYLHDIARERLGLAALHGWQHGQAAPAVSYADLPLFGGN